MFMCKNCLIMIVFVFNVKIECKYIEGELITRENWAFLARFCFLSEEGQFEYQIDFNEDQGDANLLLYYDTDDQWPSVYKTNRTCEERESVLNIRQNQIINLTARVQPYRDLSGCMFMQTPSTIATYTLVVPTLPPVNKTIKGKVTLKPAILVTKSGTIESSTSTWSTIIPTTLEHSTESSTYIIDDFSSSTPPQEYETFSSTNIYEEKHLPISTESYVSQSATTENLIIKKDLSQETCTMTDSFEKDELSVVTMREDLEVPENDDILPVLMAFTIAYSFLLLGIVVCSIELKSRQLLHTTYKIFVFSVIIQLFGILFVSSCYLKLAVSGFMVTKMRRLGMVLMGISETGFLLLLLLLAKGYTVTRGRLPLPASVKLTVFMCLYAVTYVAIFIYEAKVFDPGEVLYLYESPAGYALITLRIIAWCMFIYSTIFTLKHYPEKGNFYYPFNIFGTLWFVAGPAFILSANTYIDKWVRESVVFAVLLFIAFGGHLMFLVLTMPSVANKNFPYHVRTTQIGIMEFSGRTGTSTMDQFGHHIYEPTATVREQTVIIPLTRRTEEIFEGMYTQSAFRRTDQSNDNSKESEENQEQMDKMIDNVMNWSLAKNAQALELPMNRINRNSSNASVRSNISDLSRESSIKEHSKSLSQNNFDDYIRDVPIELFTVSKMIVTTNNVPKTNGVPSE